VLICGPYRSGTDGDAQRIAANRRRLESFALPIYERGHLPLVAEWLALPIVEAASRRDGDAHSDALFERFQYPVAQRLLARCDAVLRIPGASRGADLDVARAQALGLPVLRDVTELPVRAGAAAARELS
jgi:hypothetical protein